MFLFDFFRSFLPLHNPLGFGAADFVEFALVILLVALVLARGALEPAAAASPSGPAGACFCSSRCPSCCGSGCCRVFPVPTPGGADDYGYILLADTLRHFRLTNPMHPMHRFFETVFVLQRHLQLHLLARSGAGAGVGVDLLGIRGRSGAGSGASAPYPIGCCAVDHAGVGTRRRLLAVSQFGPLNE